MSGEDLGGGWIQPDWWGPPVGWVGGVLPFNLVIAQGNAGAILAEDIAVYPTGIAFELRALMRPEPPPERAPARPPAAVELGSGARPRVRVRSVSVPEGFEREEVPADRVHCGVEFEDGRRAERGAPVGGPGEFTISAFQEGEQGHPDRDANVILMPGGGSSSNSLHESRFVWPLPHGDLRLFGSWEDASIPEQSAVIEAGAIEEALGRARLGWRA